MQVARSSISMGIPDASQGIVREYPPARGAYQSQTIPRSASDRVTSLCAESRVAGAETGLAPVLEHAAATLVAVTMAITIPVTATRVALSLRPHTTGRRRRQRDAALRKHSVES